MMSDQTIGNKPLTDNERQTQPLVGEADPKNVKVQVFLALQKAKRLRELEHSITEEKVFDYLLQQSTITDA